MLKPLTIALPKDKRCSNKETTINLKPKHYKSLELFNLIQTQLG